MKNYLEQNVKAFEKFQEAYPDKNIREYCTDDPNNAISTLRTIYGLCCAGCGHSVTMRNLQFSEYSPKVTCYSCSQK